jgi:multidrug efflux pump subunit AcrA (membrane-fusion protein)
MKRILSVLLLLAAGVSAEIDPTRKDRTVILDEVAVKNLGIETVEAEETAFEETVFALGRIKVAPGHQAVVSSRVPGRVIRVNAHIDAPIKEGAVAVLLESRQPGEPPPTVSLAAPISGLVSAMHVVTGQPVSADTSLLEIIDLTEVHGVAAVPEYLIGKLMPRQKGRVRVAAWPDREFVAELAHLGAEAEAESGTLEAAFHIENPELILRPGMRAEFSIVTSKRDGVMSIPREALQGDASGRFVYIKDYELKNAFVKTTVQLGAQNDRFVEVTGGLLPGDEVVTRGAYSLAFAGKGSVSLKEAMDAAHGHPHNEDGSEISKEQQAAGAGASGAQAYGDGKQGSLVMFLSATNALLFILLVISLVLRRKPAAA